MIFNSCDWHIKNDITYKYKSTLWYIMVYLGKWRMPLLVLISGAGTFLALGNKTIKSYLKERFKRLFIPFIAGIFILVPVQVYFERIELYDSLISYYPHMFDGIYPIGNFSWHHLWFIAYLFFISIVVSPFLNYLRSNNFKNTINRLARIVSSKLGANYFLIPIIISQLILRPFFPEDTHDFTHDWAAISYYIIYFVSGFIILSSNQILDSIIKNRIAYFVESVFATFVMFTIPYLIESDYLSNFIWSISSYVLAWSCGLSVLGYTKRYLNKDSNFRNLANEAIYPFYLLHQPIIVIIGYYVTKINASIFFKAIIICCTSFVCTIGIYWYFIKPYNVLRLIFGMKPLIKSITKEKNIKRRSIFKSNFIQVSYTKRISK